MYTWTMSWLERNREFQHDQQVMEPMRQYTASRLRKFVRKAKTFPHYHLQEVSTPSKNRYLWLFMFADRQACREFRYQFLSFALIQSEKGVFVFTSFEGSEEETGSVLFIPHFFSRYAERTGQAFSTPMSCIEAYLTRNFPAMACRNALSFSSEAASTSYEVCAASEDGVGLGLCDPTDKHCILLKTFITFDMLRSAQRDDVYECMSMRQPTQYNQTHAKNVLRPGWKVPFVNCFAY